MANDMIHRFDAHPERLLIIEKGTSPSSTLSERIIALSTLKICELSIKVLHYFKHETDFSESLFDNISAPLIVV